MKEPVLRSSFGMKGRGSGILIHLTSLPSPFGIGDMGPSAYRFADFLWRTKQSYWQILPLNPTEPGHGNSPYHCSSAFACNPLLISPELLVRDGLLDQVDMDSLPAFSEKRIDYDAVTSSRAALFQRAFDRFKQMEKPGDYEAFYLKNAYWLDDFALFAALKKHFQGLSWNDWPPEMRNREQGGLKSAKKTFSDAIQKEIFLQYAFHKQWRTLRQHCNQKDIQIIGDVPMYVVYDSSDVWVHPEFFHLDQEKRLSAVAGVPPDYFSKTGQLWGNPVYRWEALKKSGYAWWLQRMAHNLDLFDAVRIDHFRGFLAYWEVRAEEKTAIHGRWVEAPAMDFFRHVQQEFPVLPIIAEDLGTITPDVWELMEHFQFPGMKVLLFAFGDDLATNPYIPHNHVKNCIVYTGTHDNNTIRGWFEGEARPEDKQRLFRYIGRKCTEETVHRELIRLAMMSVADTVMIPIQDLLGLGEEARMNLPSSQEGNWEWRLLADQITAGLADVLGEMTETYGRKTEGSRITPCNS